MAPFKAQKLYHPSLTDFQWRFNESLLTVLLSFDSILALAGLEC